MSSAKPPVGYGHLVATKSLWGLSARLPTSLREPLSIMETPSDGFAAAARFLLDSAHLTVHFCCGLETCPP